jgi:uncharacterized membrane protein YtjA (UPF0391 family)
MLVTVSSSMLAQAYTSPTLGTLLWLAIVFFILSLVAYLLGARGVAGMSAGMGRTMMFVFLVLAVIFLIVNFIR